MFQNTNQFRGQNGPTFLSRYVVFYLAFRRQIAEQTAFKYANKLKDPIIYF